MARLDNQKLKQIFLLTLILGLAYLLLDNLTSYFSGMLGALTLYVLFRNFYNKLVYQKGWKDWVCATAIILMATLVILLPFAFLGKILVEKITYIVTHPAPLIAQWNIFTGKIEEMTGIDIMSADTLMQLQGMVSSSVPNMLGSTVMALVNIAVMYFVLFFMLINGEEMEAFFKGLFPMHEHNTEIVGNKAKEMIISNTIVIPLLAFIQGLFAMAGYLIFGVEEAVIMAVLTGISSVIPVVGTMIIWIPLSVVLIAQNHVGQGIGLLIYGGVVITNIDNVIRFMLQKKIADVHPLITVFGVIVGVNVFGFVGLIFGPTLISLFILLLDLYRKEFAQPQIPKIVDNSKPEPDPIIDDKGIIL